MRIVGDEQVSPNGCQRQNHQNMFTRKERAFVFLDLVVYIVVFLELLSLRSFLPSGAVDVDRLLRRATRRSTSTAFSSTLKVARFGLCVL
jgi:hypothetical protein